MHNRIHGGAFQEGSNQGPFGLYDGGEIAQRGNVIVVSINYRLGAFGWLVTDTLRGNFGLMDQRLAMTWVQRNIGVFGGDKNQVTLFGESAGGASVGIHMVSPPSKGLFKRAIMESAPTGNESPN
jgi:carboxylesterase type B